MKKEKRVLAVCALLGIAVILGLFLKNENKSVTKSIFAMDTYMELTAYGRNSEEAIAAAEAEIYRLEALLSTGSETSEITYLNKEKEGALSEDTQYLLQRSMELWERTNGAFDVTIYPIMRAWGFTDKEYRVPTDEELKTLLENVSSGSLVYDKEKSNLTLPAQMEIDFGGIAKGYTSERVAQIMSEYGVSSAKLNLGGNVQTVGAKTDGSLWRIAVKSPDPSLPYLGIVSVKNKAIVTSGGYERYFEKEGKRYHHIINPKTGKPVQNGLVSVTIVCEDGTLADGLSTALFVLGKDEAIAYWREHSQEFDTILYDDTGMLYVTQGLKDCFTSELEYEVIM